MKYLVLSDIHGNLDALNAVLAAEISRVEGIICLGDVVGYGCDPGPCVARLKELEAAGLLKACVTGNHDAGVRGSIPSEWFNTTARFALGFTRYLLRPEDLAWLSALPVSSEFRKGFLAVHGSPVDQITGYLFGGEETEEALRWLNKHDLKLCFVGHTHTPAYFVSGSGKAGFHPMPGTIIRFTCRGGGELPCPGIVNPGSVGFPRSRPEEGNAADYPAEYAVWDSESMAVTFREARYDRRRFEEGIARLYESAE